MSCRTKYNEMGIKINNTENSNSRKVLDQRAGILFKMSNVTNQTYVTTSLIQAYIKLDNLLKNITKFRTFIDHMFI